MTDIAQPNEDQLPYPILIGDIGGTNARFSMLLDADSDLIEIPTAQTADFDTFEEAVQSRVLDTQETRPRSAILAAAGPVENDEIDLTNCPWVVRPLQLIEKLGFEDVILVNDFAAQALAGAIMTEEHLEPIGPQRELEDQTRVVMGPGTGLGVAGLVNLDGKWMPVPGEGGHVDIGPRSKRDYEIFPHFETRGGRLGAEELICGRGLVNIYKGVCRADGVEPSAKTPADVSTAGLDEAGEDAQAREALKLFVTYLGRVAGDLALIFLARGGVFLAGGISQKILPALKGPEFRAAFEDKAPHKELFKEIPTYVMTHPFAAIAGLAEFARNPGLFGMSTKGRRWKA